MDYEAYCGLYLNVDRIRSRRTWEVANGFNIATSNVDLDGAWYESLAETQEEVDELVFQGNAARMERRAREKLKGMMGL